MEISGFEPGREACFNLLSEEGSRSFPCVIKLLQDDRIEVVVSDGECRAADVSPGLPCLLFTHDEALLINATVVGCDHFPVLELKPERKMGQFRSSVRIKDSFPVRFNVLDSGKYEELKGFYRTVRNCWPEGDTPFPYGIERLNENESVSMEQKAIIQGLYELNRKLDLIIAKLSGVPLDEEGAVLEGKAVDISGSGMKFHCRSKGVGVKDNLKMELWLPISPNFRMNVIATVIRVDRVLTEEDEDLFEVAVQFSGLNPIDEEQIVSYIFKRQREMLRLRRLNGGL